MQKGKNTTAWGRRSRGSHHSVGQQLAGGSHWRTASHPSPTAPATKTCRRAQGAPTRRRSRGSHHSVGQQLAGGSHWLTASHPFRRKAEWMGHGAIAWSRRSRGSHHCVGQQLAGGSHWRTASRPFRRKAEWMGHGASCAVRWKLAAARMNFGDVVSQELPRRHQGDTQAAQN